MVNLYIVDSYIQSLKDDSLKLHWQEFTKYFKEMESRFVMYENENQ